MISKRALQTWLVSNGMTQAQLAEALGESKVRVCRYLAGKGALTDLSKYEQIEKLTGGAVTAAQLAAEAPPTRRRRPRGAGSPAPAGKRPAAPETNASPPPPPPPAQPAVPVPEAPPPRLIEEDPNLVLHNAARRYSGVLLGQLLKLAATARSESCRLRALTESLDRLIGRPVQRVVDLTPKPPVQDQELFAIFEKLVPPAAKEEKPDDRH